MPDLEHSLYSHDLGHLRIVAELWGVLLSAKDIDSACDELVAALHDPGLILEIIEALPVEAREGLDALLAKDGRLPWASFVRRFGEIREMGPGRRDREHPHRTPFSPAEMLYYRALLARAFFETSKGLQEFAYIPDDLLPLLKRTRSKETPKKSIQSASPSEPLGRPATPADRTVPVPASDVILDEACTLLAALRLGMEPRSLRVSQQFLLDLLEAAGLMRHAVPQPDPVKTFLEAPRAEALRMLTDAWLNSENLNELRQLSGLTFEGEWTNQPLVTREFLLHLLEAIPEGKWWSMPAFIRAIKDRYPDFQRPAGDYDSWFVKRQSDGEYLRGFANWDAIDGRLVRYLVTGPLFWLGTLDLAAPEADQPPTAFRLRSKPIASNENGKLHVSSQGKIVVPRTVPRAVRYQVARFCEWLDEKGDEYRYQVTTTSLKHAQEQGLKVEHLLALLAKHAAAGIPPTLVKALKRWERNGTEARIEHPVVLRVSSPEVLNELRKSRAGRFLSELLGPTTVIVIEGAQSKVRAALVELGLLAEDETNKDIIDSDKPHE